VALAPPFLRVASHWRIPSLAHVSGTSHGSALTPFTKLTCGNAHNDAGDAGFKGRVGCRPKRQSAGQVRAPRRTATLQASHSVRVPPLTHSLTHSLTVHAYAWQQTN
jgi:hypothetical protein